MRYQADEKGEAEFTHTICLNDALPCRSGHPYDGGVPVRLPLAAIRSARTQELLAEGSKIFGDTMRERDECLERWLAAEGLSEADVTRAKVAALEYAEKRAS